MKNVIMILCTIVLMMGVGEMNGQNRIADLSSKVEKMTPRQFVEQRQLFQDEILEEDYVVVVSFDKIPSKKVTASLQKAGVQLLSYKSKNTYLAKVPTSFEVSNFEEMGITSVRKHIIKEKLSPEIKQGYFPEWAVKSPNTVDVVIMLTDNTERLRLDFIHQFNITHLQNSLKGGSIIRGRIAQDDLLLITTSPMVAHIDAVEPPVEELNHENRVLQKVNVLQSSLVGERNLTGEGVCVGVGDGGELGDHIDFNERVTNYANGFYASFEAHGDHVAGTVGSAGNINPTHRGMAPSCDLVIQKTTFILSNAQTYYDEHQMVLTNNSYGVGYNCEYNGTYNYSSNNLDWQSREMPEILHVFAAGNSGFSVCGNYPDGYKSVLRYYQSAKNVLTVGNVREDRTLNGGSSKGPVADGRLKPEICGIGTNVYSTGRDYNYYPGTGTSMASPSVVGTMALLNQRYRQLNNNDSPQGALMKAIACNSADDLGNAGPDYAYGYGLINGRRAAECIENNQYDSDAISDGETQTFNINIPAGVSQVKVMLYWHDVEALAYPDKALINDLDLKLTTPSGTDYLPWVLNPDTLHVMDMATRQVDTLNNIEQVTLSNPAAGTYTLTINGSSIPTGPQEFFITYDFLTPEIVLTHPYGKESFNPSVIETIQWDTDPNNTSDFTIEYSVNGGANWNLIASGIDAGVRHYSWSVPNVITEDAVIRITKEGTSITDENNIPFYILERPANLIATPICEGYLEITWDSIPDIPFYEIYTLSGAEMVAIDTVTQHKYNTGSLTVGQDYWYAVRGMTANGSKTERSIAVRAVPEAGGTCPWDYDISLREVTVNQVGRANTSIALTNAETLTLDMKNLGANNVDSFSINYQINNGAMISEGFIENIASGDSLVETFSTPTDFSTPGIYQLDVSVEISSDVDISNNEMQINITQLENNPITLPYQENFENILVTTFDHEKIGLDGVQEWDFTPNSNGGLLNFVDEGANKCIASSGFSNTNTTEGITFTLNMSNYANADDVKLNYDYKYSFPNVLGDGDYIYVRGSDTDAWIQLTELTPTGTWTASSLFNISTLLADNNQNFSSSFQIHFSQGRNTGYALDNLSLNSLSVLPVELTSFTAIRQGDDALLKWETASETNNSRFEIEVALAPLPLNEDNFKRIGTVSGNGTTTTNHQYTFLDYTPLKSRLRYYRLKQINMDGSFTYSAVRSVDFGGSSEVAVFPNPFINEINVWNLQKNMNIQSIQITNTRGELVFETFNVDDDDQLIIEIKKALPMGMYFLRLINNQKVITFPMLKGEK